MAPEEEFLALRDIFFADLGGEFGFLFTVMASPGNINVIYFK